jgi:hypothetical protein
MKVGKFRHEITFSLVRQAEPSKSGWCAEEVQVEEKGDFCLNSDGYLLGMEREPVKRFGKSFTPKKSFTQIRSFSGLPRQAPGGAQRF